MRIRVHLCAYTRACVELLHDIYCYHFYVCLVYSCWMNIVCLSVWFVVEKTLCNSSDRELLFIKILLNLLFAISQRLESARLCIWMSYLLYKLTRASSALLPIRLLKFRATTTSINLFASKRELTVKLHESPLRLSSCLQSAEWFEVTKFTFM